MSTLFQVDRHLLGQGVHPAAVQSGHQHRGDDRLPDHGRADSGSSGFNPIKLSFFAIWRLTK